MMQRYAHLDPETIKATVERLAYRKESASATNSDDPRIRSSSAESSDRSVFARLYVPSVAKEQMHAAAVKCNPERRGSDMPGDTGMVSVGLITGFEFPQGRRWPPVRLRTILRPGPRDDDALISEANTGGDIVTAPTDRPFRPDEATIEEWHAALRSGQMTCVALVQHYIERVRAYNGVASFLVTEDGAPVPEARGTVRAKVPLRFPTKTVKASSVLPDLDKYRGPALEFGRMEPTASDPDVQQQFGMIVGAPDAGQVNALATLNIRGERSVTCRGDFDRHPSAGPLPPGAPPVCEMFRRFPDALERAAELDAEYGRNPDLEKMPMYGVVFSFKDPFDTRDMRTTAGGDAHYDIDFPARDHVLVEQLRNRGAIIFAKAVNTEYNGRAGDPGGRHLPDKVLP